MRVGGIRQGRSDRHECCSLPEETGLGHRVYRGRGCSVHLCAVRFWGLTQRNPKAVLAYSTDQPDGFDACPCSVRGRKAWSISRFTMGSPKGRCSCALADDALDHSAAAPRGDWGWRPLVSLSVAGLAADRWRPLAKLAGKGGDRRDAGLRIDPEQCDHDADPRLVSRPPCGYAGKIPSKRRLGRRLLSRASGCLPFGALALPWAPVGERSLLAARLPAASHQSA